MFIKGLSFYAEKEQDYIFLEVEHII